MRVSRRKILIGSAISACAAAAALSIPPVRRLFHPLVIRMQGRQTIEDRLAEFSAARQRVQSQCEAASVSYPPKKVVLLGLKQEKRLKVFAGESPDSLREIADHVILAASGTLGPKLREGDHQVPEGIYALESLNPNSRFHVALRVGYPNAFDREMAAKENRTNLGSDIMIHGGNASIGCLAMGDPVAEELFVLAAETGIENVTIVLAPMDLREKQMPDIPDGWRTTLYQSIKTELDRLRSMIKK